MNDNQKKAGVIGGVLLAVLLAVAALSHYDVVDIGLPSVGGPRPIIFCLLHEEEDDADYSKENLALFTSTKLDEVLDEVCAKDPEDGQRMARILDNDSKADDDTSFWREFMKSSKVKNLTDDDMPYLFISDGKWDGPSGKIDPDMDVDAMIELVRKESRIRANDK